MTFIARRPPEAEPAPLYAPRQKIYPRRVNGPWRRLKWGVLGFCLALYYLLPWLRWDRGFGRPSQALLIDLPNRRGYFFNIEIWPQEVFYLTGIMIIAAVGLVNSISGCITTWLPTKLFSGMMPASRSTIPSRPSDTYLPPLYQALAFSVKQVFISAQSCVSSARR